MGKGGRDRCVELNVWSSLVPNISAEYETSYHGETHAFGNTEEWLIRKVIGVQGRQGEAAWDPASGMGRVEEHHGDYHDAISTIRPTSSSTTSMVTSVQAPTAVSTCCKARHR